MRIREATGEDSDFLLDMLLEAFNWSGKQPMARSDVGLHPEVEHYVSAWPREDDFGVVAVSEDGSRVGAAWARALPVDDPGYGFVASDIPELTLAVVAAERGRGVGRRLLEALIEVARKRGCRAMSLSVEDGNGAAVLYRAAGFRTVGRYGTSDTMLLELCD